MWVYAVMLWIVLVAGFLILHPLLRPEGTEMFPPEPEEDKEDVLLNRKEDVYAAIKEMDFDYGMGKISGNDYKELRSQYKAEALEIMKKLDGKDHGDDIDTAIEKEVQHLRLIAVREVKAGSKKADEREINYCPKCGRAVEQDDNFCRSCGAGLTLPTKEYLR